MSGNASISITNAPISDTPTVPTNLTATVIDTSQIDLSWTASTDDVGVTGYNIYRCESIGCTPTLSIGTSPTNSYSDTGLTAGTTYTYAVNAYDVDGHVSGNASISRTIAPAVIHLPDGPHPRTLDGTRLARYSALDAAGTDPQWLKLKADMQNDYLSATNWNTSEKRPGVLAILYLITGDTNWRDSAIELLEAGVAYHDVQFRTATTSDAYRYTSDTLFMAYDYMYNDLTTTQQKDIANAFCAWAKNFKDNGYQISFPGNNYFGGYFRGVSWTAVITYGETIDDVDADQPATLLNWSIPGGTGYDLMASWWDTGGNFYGGVLPEGPEYAPQTLQYILQGLDAINLGTGRDLIGSEPLNTWTEAFIKNTLHETMLDSELFPRNDWLNDSLSEHPAVVSTSYINALSLLTHYKTGQIGEELLYYIQFFTPTDYAWFAPDDKGIIYFGVDQTAVATDYKLTEDTYFFNGNNVGVVYGRSGWSAGDIAWTIEMGWRGTDHMHGETGHFAIAKDGEWVVGHEVGWGATFEKPWLHNVFSLQGTTPYNRWSPTQEYPDLAKWNPNHQFGNPNPGASYPPSQRDLPDLISDRGSWYSVTKGNLTNHYWNQEYQYNVDQPITYYTRTIVALDTGQFVLEDRFVINHCLDYDEWTADPNQSKNCYNGFNFHLAKTSVPVVSGNVITQSIVNSDITVTDVTNQLRTWTVEDEGVEKGDTVNYPHYYIAKMAGDDTIKSNKSIVVIDVRDTGVAAKTVSLVTGSNVTGTIVDNDIVLFPENYTGDNIASFAYSVTTTAPSNHLILGLGANTDYNVTINGILTTERSTNNGVLSFSSASTGMLSVSAEGR